MSDFYKTVPGSVITRLEREWLHDTAKDIAVQFPKPVIVNIGVLYGATMHCLRAGAPEANLFGVDITHKHKVHGPGLLRATMIKGDSNVCHVDFSLGIHLLFIDGDHHYPIIKGDIKGWAPKVVLGGVVSFHDYAPTQGHIKGNPELPDVRRAVDEWMALEGHHWEWLETPDSICAFRRLS